MFAGLRKPTEVIVTVVTLLAYGCPVQAIVHAFDLDERTVASWRDRAGKQCEQVHHALVEQGQLDLLQSLSTLTIFLHGENASQIGFCEPFQLCSEGIGRFAVLFLPRLQHLG